MTSQSHSVFLRQLPVGGAARRQVAPYQLPRNQEVVIGRDYSCQLILDSNTYTGVSRRHAVVRPLSQATSELWEICDLNSGNGTYINGQRLHGYQTLKAGDRILLGQNGPEFIFEYQNAYKAHESSPPPATPHPATVAKSFPPSVAPPRVPPQPDSLISFTQLFPIFSTGRDLRRKGFLIPGIITVVTVVAMFSTLMSNSLPAFLLLLGLYLAWGAFYFVYQLCGKPKPWWLLIAAAVMTFMILVSPIFNWLTIAFTLPAYALTGISLDQILNPPQGTSLSGAENSGQSHCENLTTLENSIRQSEASRLR